ncbi:hypothetical protein OJ593_11350, partial [Streptococcus anginosus]|nr:hypothetical protein [Streptococcus anginosus]
TTQHAIAGSRDYFEVMELTETERGQRPVLTGSATLSSSTAVTPNGAVLTPNDDAAPARRLAFLRAAAVRVGAREAGMTE